MLRGDLGFAGAPDYLISNRGCCGQSGGSGWNADT